ncbi:fimbria/pilus outer membrane usher protein [Paraburkholderia silvatlantica]|uniref:fimbria/pilus outer membrane usher protein n=1 Tax=Paraburkholderia silvatlantica TaxID=321895 RepID=UPI0037509015
MNDLNAIFRYRHPHANALILSQTSIAVLLSFAFANAQAQGAPAEDVATRRRPAAAAQMRGVPPPAADLASPIPDPPGVMDAGGQAAAPAVLPAEAPLRRAVVEPEPVQFNPQFLNGSSAAKVDISRFDKGNVALPGRYRATLYVNGVWLGMTDVDVRDIGDAQHTVAPVFNRDLLVRAGVDVTRVSAEASARLDATAGGSGGATLSELIPQSTAAFDIGEQRLDLSIPQAMMNRNARGWVDPKFWDDGVPAALLQYNANVYHTSGSGLSTTQAYLGINAGMNVGAWRFRYNGNVTSISGAGTHVQSMQTYLQRSFSPIKSQFTFGDSYTDGSIFDSFGVRGAQIGTDDRMYPESQRSYAPTVRGIANTNAKVEIRQNGNLIYETTVAPGPFVIDDLYPTGYGGDLQVVVTEADGSQRVSIVPYAAPVNALREGRWRYSIVAGQYRDTSLNSHPFVFEANVQHGISNLITLYGGVIGSGDYFSAAAGVALDTRIGAFAFDVTQANTTLHGGLPRRNGQSLRLSYSRVFSPTNTDVTLAAYRYSTSGFLNLTDAMTLRDLSLRGIANTNNGIQKGRLQVTLNQSLSRWGAIYASGFTQNYWNKPGTDTSFQVGYNTSIRRVGVGVSLSRALDVNSNRWDNRVMLNLNIPLDIGSKIANTTTSYTHDSRDGSNQIQESFTGTAGVDNAFNYGVTAGYNSGSGSNGNVSANAGYLSRYAQLRANAGYANGYTQVGGGATGAVLAYRGGVVASPQTGDTFAVIEANDAVDARVSSSPGVRVDGFGHALIAGMNPYSLNLVDIDTKGLPMGVVLNTTEQQFAPTAGAVVRLKFDTQNRGRPVVMRLRRANGVALPFGADVLDEEGNNVGTVSQGSRAMYFSKVPESELTVRWGAGIEQSCKVRYSAPPEVNGEAAAPGAANSRVTGRVTAPVVTDAQCL